MRDFIPETHFVSTVHQIFFGLAGPSSSGISAIRVVEQAIFHALCVPLNLPEYGGLVLFGIPNVINQALANPLFWHETLCMIGMGYALPALDFPLSHRNSCRLFRWSERPVARLRCPYMKSPDGCA
ncbi:hypothetical protein [Pseudomonas sp.]|uniref:hypothetical protein n=1 Tax=Pseudomonas sp. TaxID=306 RepID=UPI0027B94690|nr:hypothetical protein [Pseudomonas sp.]